MTEPIVSFGNFAKAPINLIHISREKGTVSIIKTTVFFPFVYENIRSLLQEYYGSHKCIVYEQIGFYRWRYVELTMGFKWL